MTTYLLDVNVLIALIDPAHVQHDAAHAWFASTGQHSWATCPLTENGVLRIVGHENLAIKGHPRLFGQDENQGQSTCPLRGQ